MKKIVLLLLLLSCISFGFADQSVECMEEEGINTRTPNEYPSCKVSRDIPPNGLLLIPDSGDDRVMAFDPITGELYDANFIPTDPTNLATPIQAGFHPDGNSILVSDQVKDGVLEYDLNGNFLGWFAPAGGINNAILDNVRGWCAKPDGNILVTCASGANSDAIAEFDASGNYLGNFIAPNPSIMDGPFGIVYRHSEDDYLVSSSTSDAIHRFDNAGNYQSDLVSGINFPEQIFCAGGGNLLVATFSLPSGCYEYNRTGSFVGYYDVVTGLRGVYELPNNNILVTNGDGVYEINRSNQLLSTKISGVNARFITFVEGSGVSVDDPAEQSMIRNFPNPMHNVTTISFAKARIQPHAVVEIYNTRGQLLNELPANGQTQVEWNGTDFHGNYVSNGIYFYKVVTKQGIISNKLLLLR